MKPSDIFGVIVRSVGFLIIIASLWQMIVALDAMITMPSTPGFSEMPLFLIQIVVFIFGAVCFLGADAIVRMAYRKNGEP